MNTLLGQWIENGARTRWTSFRQAILFIVHEEKRLILAVEQARDGDRAAETSARSEYSRFGKGVAEGEVTYKRSLPVKEGTTYVLRSIDYGTSDVLVGLHVLRRDMDGSVIIAWKVLKRYPVPELNKAE